MPQPPAPPQNEDSLRGFLFALSAYVLWGFLPLYLKALAHIPPSEVIAHRVIWSLPIAGGVLWAQGRTADLKIALRTPRMVRMAALTAFLVSINWGLYVWSIGTGHALDSALGYYINPLFSVMLGAVFLRERLGRSQITAILLAVGAVTVLTVEAGRLPWIAIVLPVTWGFYAFFRKTLPIGPNQGFFLEVLLLSVPALAYLVWLQATGQSHFLTGSTTDTALLFGCGAVTAIPLMLYANGAKLLRLSTIGIMQYLTPTMIFLIAVFVFGEPFGTARAIAFPMIWLALIVYSAAFLKPSRRGS